SSVRFPIEDVRIAVPLERLARLKRQFLSEFKPRSRVVDVVLDGPIWIIAADLKRHPSDVSCHVVLRIKIKAIGRAVDHRQRNGIALCDVDRQGVAISKNEKLLLVEDLLHPAGTPAVQE